MDSILSNIVGACVAGAVFVTLVAWPVSQAEAGEAMPAPATRAAISALYVASDAAQRAIDTDVCKTDETFIGAPVGASLSGEDLRQYGHVKDALSAAYSASEGSDTAVEQVQSDFCFGASER